MADRINIILLCEDTQHESFVLRFMGQNKRNILPDKNKKGRRGGAENVIKNYPDALKVQRKHPNSALIVVIDGDTFGYNGRLAQLDEECRKQGINPREPGDRVAVIVPTRNIETWITYLRGDDEQINEEFAYEKLPRERGCGPQAKKLNEICVKEQRLTNFPLSLKRACREYKERLR